MQKHSTGKTRSIAEAHSDDSPKTKAPQTRVESWGARRTALPEVCSPPAYVLICIVGMAPKVTPGTLWPPPRRVRVAYLASRTMQDSQKVIGAGPRNENRPIAILGSMFSDAGYAGEIVSPPRTP